MNDENLRTIKDLGPLHKLLLKAAPTAEQAGMKAKNPKRQSDPQRRSITTLAFLLGVDTWTIYLWIKRNHIPAARAKEIVDKCDGRVSLEEFHQFVYG